jgi:acetyltransferase-like isoleucine patch superfamily enzyme
MDPFVHSSAFLEENITIGKGSKIWHHAQIRTGAKIGKTCVIGKGEFIDTNVIIGDSVKIQNYVSVYQGVTIDDDVFVGPHVVFTNDLKPRATNSWKIVETTVEKGVSIGANATVICGITLEKYSMVGAGSVVTKSIPPHQLVIGNPARFYSFICYCGEKLSENLTKETQQCRICKKIVDLSN